MDLNQSNSIKSIIFVSIILLVLKKTHKQIKISQDKNVVTIEKKKKKKDCRSFVRSNVMASMSTFGSLMPPFEVLLKDHFQEMKTK